MILHNIYTQTQRVYDFGRIYHPRTLIFEPPHAIRPNRIDSFISFRQRQPTRTKRVLQAPSLYIIYITHKTVHLQRLCWSARFTTIVKCWRSANQFMLLSTQDKTDFCERAKHFQRVSPYTTKKTKNK